VDVRTDPDDERHDGEHSDDEPHEVVSIGHAVSVPTWGRVQSVRVSQRRQAGRCPYCTERHYPPLSYWYAVYAYLARW
jgi:hypothetical protein